MPTCRPRPGRCSGLTRCRFYLLINHFNLGITLRHSPFPSRRVAVLRAYGAYVPPASGSSSGRLRQPIGNGDTLASGGNTHTPPALVKPRSGLGRQDYALSEPSAVGPWTSAGNGGVIGAEKSTRIDHTPCRRASPCWDGAKRRFQCRL